jgi:hypothetical protein
MEIVKLIVSILFFNFALAQENKAKVKVLNYNETLYYKMGTDSIKKCFEKNISQKLKSSSTEPLISDLYNFNDLKFVVIPMYRLFNYDDKELNFNCNKNFIDYVTVYEYYKYFAVYIFKDNMLLNRSFFPNLDMETERTYTPSFYTNHDFEDWDYAFINKLEVEKHLEHEEKLLFKNKILSRENFLFHIQGFNELLFEIDNEEVYVYEIDDKHFKKHDVNTYIKEKYGSKYVEEIIKGNYLYQNSDTLKLEPCKKSKINQKVILKVGKINKNQWKM